MFNALIKTGQWIFSRIIIIYAIIVLFALTCMDWNNIEMRTKLRHLNDAIPDFSGMVAFTKNKNLKNNMNLESYRRYFELILHYIPDDPETTHLLGFVDYYAGKQEKAISLFKNSSVVHNTQLFWPNYNLGVIYFKRQNWSKAYEYLIKTVESSPKVNVILMENSQVYRQIASVPNFHYSFDDEIKTAENDAYILLLSCLYHLGLYDKMVIVANIALADPSCTSKDAFYYYAGLGFYGMQQMQKAFELFQKSLSLDNQNPEVYIYLSNIYQNLGQVTQARTLMQVSYALHQKNDPRFPFDARIGLRFF